MEVVVFNPRETYRVTVPDDTVWLDVAVSYSEVKSCFVECVVSMTLGYMVYVVKNREVSADEIYKSATELGALCHIKSYKPDVYRKQ